MDLIKIYIIGFVAVFCIVSFLIGADKGDKEGALEFLIPVTFFWPIVLFVGLIAGILYGTFSLLYALGSKVSSK